MLSVIENIFVLNIDQYCEKKSMNLKIHSRTAVKDSGAGASTCSCASLVQEGPGRPCLVQILWWKRKSRDKESGTASVHARYGNSLILFVCQVRSFQLLKYQNFNKHGFVCLTIQRRE